MDKKKNQWWIPLVAVFGALALSGGSLFGCYKCAEYVYDGDVETVSDTEHPQADESILTTEKISETNEILDNTIETIPTEENKEEIVTEEPIDEVGEAKEEVVTNDFLISLKANMDSNLADHVYSILVDEIGFEELEFIKRVDNTDNYEIWAESTKIMITAMPADGEESEYIRVFQPQGDIFYEEGQVITTGETVRKENAHYDNVDTYYIIAQSIVKDTINTSNKMKFAGEFMDADDIGYGWKDDYVVVKSWVEIRNDYGVYEKYDFLVEFIPTDLDNFQYDTVYVNIGGQEIGTFVDVDSLHIVRH